MKFKNRDGSTLALTLMVFAVLMIFATFILGFMVTENKQAIYHQNKTQAYYLARSGAVAVEKVIMEVFDEGKEIYNSFLDEVKTIPENIVGDYTSIGNTSVTLSKQMISANEILLKINSTAEINGVNQTVEKILPIDVTPGENEEISLGDEPIIALYIANMEKDNDGIEKIKSISYNGTKDGDFPPYEFEYEDYDSIPKPNPDEYPDDTTVWGSRTLGNLNSTTNYFIDGNLEIESNANITVNGIVNIYVKGYVYIRGYNNNTVNININGVKNNLSIFVYGENKKDDVYSFFVGESITKTSNFNFRGNLFIKQGDVLLYTKDSFFEGNIITNGENFYLAAQTSNGVDHNFKGIIYAPLTDIVIKDPSSEGAFTLWYIGYIVGKNVEYEKIHNKSAVVKPEPSDGVTKPKIIPGLDIMIIKNGYFK